MDIRRRAVGLLGSALSDAGRHEDALAVRGAHLAMLRRIGASEESMLVAQSNLALTYRSLGREQDALRLRQEVYSGCLNLLGGEHARTLIAAHNLAASFLV